MARTVADQMVQTLAAAGVRRSYGIVGDGLNGSTDMLRRDDGIRRLQIDALFNSLIESSIRTIVCRHEQNSAFTRTASVGRTVERASSPRGPNPAFLAFAATGLMIRMPDEIPPFWDARGHQPRDPA